MASKRRNMFQKNKTQETTENGSLPRSIQSRLQARGGVEDTTYITIDVTLNPLANFRTHRTHKLNIFKSAPIVAHNDSRGRRMEETSMLSTSADCHLLWMDGVMIRKTRVVPDGARTGGPPRETPHLTHPSTSRHIKVSRCRTALMTLSLLFRFYGPPP
ncbi:hypothetical protein AAG570_004910 [Ranatra chinensis]|uniref:Uncharacterized protein n=1 Tax=Ranatra chinensis TaxID=642074 RepID=A0ABD0XYW9_9HEMI